MALARLRSTMKDLCKAHSAEYSEPSWNQTIGVTENLFSGSQPINGLRMTPGEGLTGWFIYAGTSVPMGDHDYQPICAEHLVERKVSYLKFLALPPGWRFLVDDQGYEDVWFDKDVLKSVD